MAKRWFGGWIVRPSLVAAFLSLLLYVYRMQTAFVVTIHGHIVGIRSNLVRFTGYDTIRSFDSDDIECDNDMNMIRFFIQIVIQFSSIFNK